MRSNLIDAIRSLAFLIMCADHIMAGMPAFRAFAHKHVLHFFGVFSMHEVFIMISASVVARTIALKGIDETRYMLIKRIKKLFIAQIFCLFIVLFLAYFSEVEFFEYRKINSKHDTISSIAFGVVLLFQPMLLHIFPIYIFITSFILLFKLEIKKMLLPSFVLWVVAQFLDFETIYFNNIVLPMFDFFAWQFLFVVSMLITFNSKYIEIYKKQIFYICGLFCLAAFAYRHIIYQQSDLVEFWISRQDMGFLRLINAIAVMLLSLSLADTLAKYKMPSFLLKIGRNTLQLTVIHILISYITIFYWQKNYVTYSIASQFLIFLIITLSPLVYFGFC